MTLACSVGECVQDIPVKHCFQMIVGCEIILNLGQIFFILKQNKA